MKGSFKVLIAMCLSVIDTTMSELIEEGEAEESEKVLEDFFTAQGWRGEDAEFTNNLLNAYVGEFPEPFDQASAACQLIALSLQLVGYSDEDAMGIALGLVSEEEE